MKQLIIIVAALSLIFSTDLKAQTEIDALRYSQTYYGSTARSMAMGGAFGALGADFSVLSSNPAGIGLYRKSEFTFTPGFLRSQTEASYLDRNAEDDKYNVNVSSLGIVWSKENNMASSALKFWSFGIGLNRLNNFNNRTLYEGVNRNNSLLDLYAQQAEGTLPDNLDNFAFDANLAYQTYLIDPLPTDSTMYTTAIPFAGQLQRRSVETRGALDELAISFGGNINDKFYFGATLGMPFIKYTEEVVYQEIDVENSIYNVDSSLDFNSFKLNQDLETTGSGINFKFGILFRPVEWVRLGGAVHSPTYFYNMHDEYSSTISASFDNNTLNYEYASPLGVFDYNLTTPFKAMANVGFIIMNSGLISLEYEFLDYSEAKLRSSTDKFFNQNENIQSIYTSASNFRVGAEYKYLQFTFRGGAGYYGSPFKSSGNTLGADQVRMVYSGGIGYREEEYFIDLGYSLTSQDEFYRPYTLKNQFVQGAKFDKITHNILLTLGLRF